LYRLDLYIYENVTNAKGCEKKNNFPSRHSSRSLEILHHDAEANGEVPACGKVCFI
jgi:hypothetical protein